MSPSSLIFVAVIAIWAAYLVIETSRRREYLATARTVDRFSASMRVLQRRAVRRESAEAFEASTAPMRSTSSVLLHRRPEITARAAAEARAEVHAEVRRTPAHTGGATALAARQRRAAQVRRNRVVALAALVSGVAALATAVLAGLGFVSWFLPASALAVGVLLLVVLRRRAVATRPVRTTHTTRTSQAPQRRDAELLAPMSVETVAPSRTEVLVPQHVPFDYAREVEPSVVAERDEVLVGERDPLHGEPGWQPVPVPPPTYTLKARAEHPVPEPLVLDAEPVFEEAWDEDYVTYHRASGA
ncbi:MAG: hypothetical protein Q4G43_08205 [Mobilicoccus sp.]|nr:hypothetical protein [Mobilicoccus sp.]